jgi:hypothetical protein
MTAFNVVRFRVKPGSEQKFIDAHRQARTGFKGFLGGSLVRTGDQTFCMIGEWRSFDDLAAARPQMIAILDSFRDTLEDLGGGLGVTDPVSGEVVVKMPGPKPAKKPAARPKAKRAAKKRAAKKRKR